MEAKKDKVRRRDKTTEAATQSGPQSEASAQLRKAQAATRKIRSGSMRRP